jgi:hypothetical protein
MFDIDYDLLPWLLAAWPLAMLAILLMSKLSSMRVSGLCVFYIAGLAMIHWPGGAILNVSWYGYYPPSMVFTGFVYSTIAMLAFTVGVAVVQLIQSLRHRPDLASEREPAMDTSQMRRYALVLAVFGVGSSVLLPYISFIPSATALLGWLGQLPVVALCLMVALSTRRRDGLPWLWLAASLAFPVFTAMTSGFLGFGVMSMLLILCFVICRVRLRPHYALLMVGFTYLMMSVFVTYMRDRSLLREAVWYLAVPTEDVLAGMVQDFEWFDPDRADHLRRIDSRLNQNWLVGSTVYNVEQGRVELYGADLLLSAAVAVIPRALWPDKPSVGGGGDVASRLTGETFAEGTSVGAGQVMEFYGSFGMVGVITGMLLLGGLLALCDVNSRRHLDNQRGFSFLRWFLPGMALCQPGGNLTEMTSGLISALLAAALAQVLLSRWLQKPARLRAEAETDPELEPNGRVT